MSRAPDPNAVASAAASDSQAVYNDIVFALNSSISNLLDIEFLGKSHPLPPDCNVLVDGNSIAVPKLKLIQAFVVARQLFFDCLRDFKEDKFQKIRNATAIILLMDPEHLTAANSRKSIIQTYSTGPKAQLEDALRLELLVINSFLTSRLHRHTKSPTLWSHRRWLLEIVKSNGYPYDIQRDLTAVVLVAAERHPKNYYAWLQMRWLVQTFGGRDSGAEDSSKILSTAKDWCLRHPADTSGWSFLLFYLFSVEPQNARIEANSSICKEVLGLAASLQWTHESVWVFLRTLVAAGDIEKGQRASFSNILEASITAQPVNSKVQTILKNSQEWCAEYSK